MTKKRRRHSDEFKAQVALEAVKGVKTLSELSATHGVHPTVIAQWKRHLVDGSAEVFSRKNGLGGKSEEELTSYVALNVQGSSVRSIAIWITRGGIHVSAELHLLGQHTVEAALDVTCHDGQLQTRMQHATLDRRPLPRFVLASIQEATNDALADAHLFIDVEQIILREGSVLILATRE